jgi:hypothetical protein
VTQRDGELIFLPRGPAESHPSAQNLSPRRDPLPRPSPWVAPSFSGNNFQAEVEPCPLTASFPPFPPSRPASVLQTCVTPSLVL